MIPFSLILYSGDFDRIHYGLLTATTAAAMGRPASVFITMAACRAFLMPDGWKKLTLSSGVEGIDAVTPEALNMYFQAQHLATFEEVVEMAKALSVRFTVCEMGLRSMQIPKEELDPAIPFTSMGMAGFLQEAAAGTLIMV